MTIDTLTFLNFDDDSLTNRNLFIELRDNVFFMFSKFMISTFVHEFLSREFVILLFSAICINIENDSKNVFDFNFATIFLFFETIIFHSWKNVFDFMNFATTKLKISRIVYDFSAKYNLILMRRVKSIFFFFYSYFAIRDSRNVFTIFTCVAFFVFINDVKIAIVRAMFFRACVVYDNSFAMFIDMIVFLTIKTLS
jgi:hypothetical protein